MLNICYTGTPMIDREVGWCKAMASLFVLCLLTSTGSGQGLRTGAANANVDPQLRAVLLEAVASADGEAIRSVITNVYPHPDNLVFVIIGDADLIRDDIAKYGPITEIAITDL